MITHLGYLWKDNKNSCPWGRQNGAGGSGKEVGREGEFTFHVYTLNFVAWAYIAYSIKSIYYFYTNIHFKLISCISESVLYLRLLHSFFSGRNTDILWTFFFPPSVPFFFFLIGV